MKTTIIASLAVLCLCKAIMMANEKPSNKACNTFAAYTAEKMWACGMLRSYDAVQPMAERFSATFTQREVSSNECVAETMRMEQQSCREFEMMLNSLMVRK